MSLVQLRALVAWCAEHDIPDANARLEPGEDGKPVVYAHIPAEHPFWVARPPLVMTSWNGTVERVRVVVSISPRAFSSDYEEPVGA